MSVTDLDPFLRELTGEQVTVRMLGREWRLRAEVPNATMLTIQRAATDPDFKDAPGDDLTLLRGLLDPPEQADELWDAGVGPKGIALLLAVALGVMQGKTPEETVAALRAGEPDDGDAPDPKA